MIIVTRPCGSSSACRGGINRRPRRLVDHCADDPFLQGSQRAQPLLELSVCGTAPLNHDEEVVKDLSRGTHVDFCREFGRIENDPFIVGCAHTADSVKEIAPQQVEIAKADSTRQKIEVQTSVALDHLVCGA